MYECRYVCEEWVCYVFAATCGKAKSLFNTHFSEYSGDFIYVRANIIGKSESIEKPSVVDCESHKDYWAVVALGGGYEPEEQL